jgi:hypothetical protein
MTLPKVTLTELDGALGVLPASAGAMLAIVGASSKGPVDVPSAFGRVQNLTATFGDGPMVEAAAHHIERNGGLVLCVRTGDSVAGDAGTLDDSLVTGTSVVTLDPSGEPLDDFEAYFRVVKNGTVGTAGITFQWSLDGGRTLSPETALGTATEWTFPDSGGLKLMFAAGTLVGGDTVTFTTTAPQWNGTELQTALDALGFSSALWAIVEVVGAIDANTFDVVDAKIAGLNAGGKYRAWMGNTRLPDEGEDEGTYLAAMSLMFGAKATTMGGLCAGSCKLRSSVSGRIYRRPVVMPVAARQANVSEEVDIADVNLGSLSGVSIRDVNGNPDQHDEAVNPGLDDARFITLRTWEGYQGVYITRPRIFSADGSDFSLVPHRLVMNICEAALRVYFIRRLNRPIRVDPTTGFILEEEALEIEAGALSTMRAVLMAKPKASGVQFRLSRTDNLLVTKTLTGDARIIPLAYIEFIEITVGYFNPALQVQLQAA